MVVAAFDVGGTSIKAAMLYEDGKIIDGTVNTYPAKSKDSKEVILDNLFDVLTKQIDSLPDKTEVLSGIGFAFPGPFDYENGICIIEGVDKYESIFGVNIREVLTERIAKNGLPIKTAPNLPIVFENDAALFSLGEWQTGKAHPYNKCVCVTIGTGSGSSFLEAGSLVKSGDGIPDGGYIFPVKFKDSIIDDYVSKRGILKIAHKYGFEGDDVKAVSELASAGDANAIKVFDEFGADVGAAIIQFIKEFKPDAVVFGGNISKSFKLFEPKYREVVGDIATVISDDTSVSTYSGVIRLLDIKHN